MSRHRPVEEMTDQTIAVAAEMVNLLLRLPPEDRLNAVVAIVRCWADFKDIQTCAICGHEAGADRPLGPRYITGPDGVSYGPFPSAEEARS